MTGDLDVRAVRRHFAFPAAGRVVTGNTASTQPLRELTGVYRSLAPARPALGPPHLPAPAASPAP